MGFEKSLNRAAPWLFDSFPSINAAAARRTKLYPDVKRAAAIPTTLEMIEQGLFDRR